MPAYFNDAQRQATKDAGKIAGLDVKRIINEPTAAALAYGLDKKKDEKIAVYDFGGGTFDISILEVGDNVVEVMATNGDTHLGGDDIDQRVIDWLVAEFKKDTGIDVSQGQDGAAAPQGGGREGEDRALERAGDRRSTCRSSRRTRAGPKHLQHEAHAREVRADDRRPRRAHDASRAARRSRTPGRRPTEIDEVVLVGGSTRIPLVQETVKEFFGKEPHKGVNPDEVVAIGAAVQGGVLAGDVKDVLLLDVTPLSLGIETLGGVMTHADPAQHDDPDAQDEMFSTAADNQPQVEIHVLQGERAMASDNRDARRVPPRRASRRRRAACRRSRSRSTSTRTASCTSTAKDKATGKEQTIRIEGSGGLSKDEIERMVKDAEAHAAEDKRAARGGRAAEPARQPASTSTEKTLTRERRQARRGRQEARSRRRSPRRSKDLESDDDARLDAAPAAARAGRAQGAEVLYKAQAADPGAAAPGGGAPGGDAGGAADDDVIDAEFTEEKGN